MNRRKLAKMEVMQEGDVQVHPVGWQWFGDCAMKLTGDEEAKSWIERPSEPSAVARLVEAATVICDRAYSMDKEFASVNHVHIDALRSALAAVEKEGKHE